MGGLSSPGVLEGEGEYQVNRCWSCSLHIHPHLASPVKGEGTGADRRTRLKILTS